MPLPPIARSTLLLTAVAYSYCTSVDSRASINKDHSCVVSIADYGAISGANGSRAAFANADAINRTLAKVANTPGCTVLVPPGRYVSYGGIVGVGLVDTTLRVDGTLVAEFSTTQWPGCPNKCEAFLTIQNARNFTLTSSHHFPPGFPTVPSATLSDFSAPIHPIRTSGGLIDGMGAKWWYVLSARTSVHSLEWTY